MKRIFNILYLLGIIILSSCEDKKVDAIDLSFIPSIQKVVNDKGFNYINEPLEGVLKLDMDTRNESKIETFFDSEQNCYLLISEGDSLKKILSGESFIHDYRKSGLGFDVFFTQSGKNNFKFTLNSERYNTSIADTIMVKDLPYIIKTDSVPDKILIGKKFDFIFNIAEKEISENKDVKIIAEITKGAGTLWHKEEIIARKTKTSESQEQTEPGNDGTVLKVGKNILSYQSEENEINEISFKIYSPYDTKQDFSFSFDVKKNEVTAKVDKSSQNVKVGEEAPIKLTIAEPNYDGVFTVKYELIVGSGTFSGGEVQTLSAGTHSMNFVPSSAGTHTYNLTVSDSYGTSKVVPVTAIATLAPIIIQPNLNDVEINLGEESEIILKVSEKEYNGTFTMKYDLSGSDGTLKVNNKELGNGQNTTINTGDTNLKFTSKEIGQSNLLLTISDTRGQTADVTIKIRTACTITTTTSEGGTASGGGKFNTSGAQATVKAVPEPGYVFAGWYENGQLVFAAPEYSFIVTRDRTLEAKFKKGFLRIDVKVSGEGGTVSGGGDYEYQSTAIIKATPEVGYIFAGWYENSEKISDNMEYSFTVTSNHTFEARFTKQKFTINTTAGEGGTVSGSGDYEYNTTAIVSAMADFGYIFAGWYENEIKISDSPEYSFTVTSNRTLEAKFKKGLFTITTLADEGGTVSGGGDYEYNSIATVKANPDYGYYSIGWYENGEKVSELSEYSFTVSKNITLQAKFSKQSFQINLSHTEGGTVSGGGDYEYKENATISATSNEGFEFIGWYENGTLLSNSINYSFQVTTNHNIEGKFRSLTFHPTFNVNILGSGSISGAHSQYEYGDLVDVTVSDLNTKGYSWINWTKNGSVFSADRNLHFNIHDEANYIANYKAVKYQTSFLISNDENVTLLAKGEYNTYTISKSETHDFDYNEVLHLQILQGDAELKIYITGDFEKISGDERNCDIRIKGTVTISIDY